MNPKFPTRQNPAWPTEEAFKEALYAEFASDKYKELSWTGIALTSPELAEKEGFPAVAEYLRYNPIPDNGGQAFPYDYVRGMTLRDWFAGQVLANEILFKSGSATNEDLAEELGVAQYDSKIHELPLYAKRAYRVADAMIAERKKGGAA